MQKKFLDFLTIEKLKLELYQEIIRLQYHQLQNKQV